ncbi:hypothetical protein ACLOJK_019189 [Asimina triloba]
MGSKSRQTVAHSIQQHYRQIPKSSPSRLTANPAQIIKGSTSISTDPWQILEGSSTHCNQHQFQPSKTPSADQNRAAPASPNPSSNSANHNPKEQASASEHHQRMYLHPRPSPKSRLASATSADQPPLQRLRSSSDQSSAPTSGAQAQQQPLHHPATNRAACADDRTQHGPTNQAVSQFCKDSTTSSDGLAIRIARSLNPSRREFQPSTGVPSRIRIHHDNTYAIQA